MCGSSAGYKYDFNYGIDEIIPDFQFWYVIWITFESTVCFFRIYKSSIKSFENTSKLQTFLRVSQNDDFEIFHSAIECDQSAKFPFVEMK